MSKPKVHIYNPVDETGESYRRMREAGLEVVKAEELWATAANRRDVVEMAFAPDTTVGVGVANRTTQVTRKSLESAPGLRAIVKYTVGFDNVDLDAANELGILVVHSPTEANWGGVAEGTVANILTMLKKTREKDRHVKNGGWRDPSLQGQYLGARHMDNYPGMAIGIIGLGRIGSRVADLFAPWRVRLMAYDPYVDESQFVLHNARSVDLETLLKECDVVTVHCNLTRETTKLMNAERIAQMKPSAILVNAARGPIVDVDALFDALEKKQLAGAALDVLPDEPPNPQTPILGLGDNVLLSPHMIANNVGTGLQHAVGWVEKAVFDVLRGEVPRHVVNAEVLPMWWQRFGGKSLI
ncbi:MULTISPECIES: NAD(P)-dependent oxidoreductase [unclassified Beijerinckia]|uniref:NAD(P)-dependent oxidoreductase n=1 Tax=unclassified Beijerinckia TaxID=2638183 RepID=UPI00089C4297|nr:MULTISPECIES: NAD(P)-dependent oxidoreductase [unclassified Beijerinckia]MDH7796594.1 phosphoglycerate dehydrogenase-like enzyme [Beijerinckia sp. GAS462]SEC51758.1 D-3-phosphoglycerate dehydrogenase [Beijerinckia sp. 28-YEA-48]